MSSFLNHMVDVELMEACGDELAERLQGTHPTKILTVETTGLLPAVFISKALGIPLVFARKSRQIGVSDSYQASYRSLTKATSQDLYVSTEYLNPGDRILLVDDFLAGGATADAMVRLCRMANAKVVGGGFLIEKLNDVGRAFLSGYQIPLEALCAVSIDNGNIVIAEDDTAPSRGDSLRGKLDALNMAKAEELDALKAAGEYADEPDSGAGTVYGSGA